ncbi:hypothetical protein [Streptomyces sp. NPDC005799]|uniref:hypothetical protein n=1 Tax=Streptomyces sp. NPDC005799 TaxID=3154678 RepID=UPI0033C71620
MSPGPAHLGDLLRAARVLGVSDPAGMATLARAMGLALPSASRAPSALSGDMPADDAPAGRGRAAAPPPRPPRGGDGTTARSSDPPGRTDKPDATAGTAPSRPGAGRGSAAGPPTAPGRLPEPDTRPPTGGSLLLVRAERPAPDAEAGRELWREGVAPDPGDDDAETLLGHTEAFDVPWATAPPLPASPWNPRTERAIFLAVASTYRTGRAVDHVRLVDLVVRGLAGGRVARQRVPYRRRPTTRAGALLLIDRGESMRPFRHDQEWAARLAARILPPGGLRVLDLRITRGVSRDRGRTWDPHPVPPHGQPVILLSDLGHLQPPLPGRHHSSPAGWLPYLRRLREAGTSVVCLTPYPAEEYPAAVRRTVALVPLDRRVSVRFAQTAARQDPRQAGRPR